MKKSDLPRRLSYQDAAFAYFERDEFPMNAGSVGIYEGVIPFERFLAHVEDRINLVPRYRQRLVPVPLDYALPAWIDDPAFDIARHLEPVTLPPPGDDEQLTRFAGEFFATPLKRDKPLWEIRLVQGLSGGRSAHVAKVQHCLVDGIGGVALLAALLDTAPKPATGGQRPRRLPSPPLLGPVSLFTDAVFDSWIEQLRFNEQITLDLLDPMATWNRYASIGRSLGAAGRYFARPAPKTPWNVRLKSPRRIVWQQLPFGEVRSVAHAAGGTINDIVLTTLAGALGRFLHHRGEKTQGVVVRVLIPVNVRSEEQEDVLGNRVSFMLAGLPVGEHDPVERFQAIHADVTSLKQSRQSAGLEELFALLGRMPAPLQALTGRTLTVPNMLTNMVCTNIPGPLAPLYCMDHRMVAHYAWVPLGWRMGMSMAVMSYDTGIYFSVTADEQVPGDIAPIAGYLSDAFDELRECYGVPKERREVPEFLAAPAASGAPWEAPSEARSREPAAHPSEA
jgi:diacylglycerol O-acyltransferase